MPEVWKDIEGYEGYYQVSNQGRVKSVGREIFRPGSVRKSGWVKVKEKMLTGCVHKTGYRQVLLTKNGKKKLPYVSRLVLSAFDRPPQADEQCNHRDFDKLNNHIDNLEWTTRQENMKHFWDSGRATIVRGEKHHMTTLTAEQVKNIKTRLATGKSGIGITLAREYGVGRTTISNINNGHTWSHIAA